MTVNKDKMGEREEIYLEPVMELVFDGYCPADLLLKEWYGSCDENIYKFVRKIMEKE